MAYHATFTSKNISANISTLANIAILTDYRWTFNNSGWFQGWSDDSLSLSLKYDFSIFNNLKGIGIWALGYDGNDSKLWDLLHAKFGQGTAPTRPNRITVKNIGEGKIKVENFKNLNEDSPEL